MHQCCLGFFLGEGDARTITTIEDNARSVIGRPLVTAFVQQTLDLPFPTEWVYFDYNHWVQLAPQLHDSSSFIGRPLYQVNQPVVITPPGLNIQLQFR